MLRLFNLLFKKRRFTQNRISFIDKFSAISCVIFSLSPTKEVSLYKPPEKEYWAILFIKSYGFYSKKNLL